MKLFFSIVCIILFLVFVSCSQKITTAIEDLSVSSPITFVPLESTKSGNSYVKVTQQNITEEQTEPKYEENNDNDEELEKKVYREGDMIAFDPIGIDPDGDVITYTYGKPLNEKGQWQTVIGDAGTYQVTITASDGKTEVEKRVIILVLSANRAPTIDGLEDMTVAEGDMIVLNPKVFDYNGDEVTVLYSKPFNEKGEWQTDYDDSGTYVAKVTVSDDQTIVEQQITITVTNTNRAPVLEEINHVSVFAGELMKITPKATDPDGDPVTLAFSVPLDANGNWQTTEKDVGTYTATVIASDGQLQDEKIVSIIINHKNKAPVISLDEVRAEETDRIVLKPTIVDLEGDEYTVTYSAPFDSTGVWTTDYDDAGEYVVTITATDSEGATSSLDATVVVYERNRAPTFQI